MLRGDGLKGLNHPGAGQSVMDSLTIAGVDILVKKDIPGKHHIHHRERKGGCVPLSKLQREKV